MKKDVLLTKIKFAMDYELAIMENGISDGTTEELTLSDAVEIVMDGLLSNTYSDSVESMRATRDWELVSNLYLNNLVEGVEGEIKPSKELLESIQSMILKDYAHILETPDEGDCPNCGGDCLRRGSLMVAVNLDTETVVLTKGDNVIDLPIEALVSITGEIIDSALKSKVGDLFDELFSDSKKN